MTALAHYVPTRRIYAALLLVIAWSFGTGAGFSAEVDEAEAVAVADLWYAMDINSAHVKLDPAEKEARINNVHLREVIYLVSKYEVRDTPPEDGKVLGYIVKYKPNGFVVVSGEDRFEPVLVFNALGTFRHDEPDKNYMPHYLAEALGGRWDILEESIALGMKPPVHAQWSELRAKLRACQSLNTAAFTTGRGDDRSTFVLWPTPTWHQFDPYNDTVVINNGLTQGIATGCVATAMAIKMRFHEWPPTGVGSHSYNDEKGNVQWSHGVNFGVQTYDWSAMPTGVLDPASSFPEVADLMYHCGVAVEMDYEVGASSAYTWDAPVALYDYFRYTGHFWLTSNYEASIIYSLMGRSPVIIQYPGHAMIGSGYRDTGSTHFFINLGWNGGSNGWYNLDNINGNVVSGVAVYNHPNNIIYVDLNVPGPEEGSLAYPFNTLHEGNAKVPDGGQLWIRAGTYTGSDNVPITFDKAMEINTFYGTVLIE